MPLTRYQIRNEYSLADPELYRAADKDDPEALLEGVAMAGLVGVLRQLGDLAEFAAEIFHELHEDVMVTAARGHGLMVRVQQLESEFPSMEKAFLSQTTHSAFFSNAGIGWHPNLKSEQNLITRGDLPRFVMDSYEESRAPPRLFLLDKFDVAGVGSCLKRYTDPSFYKLEASSYEMTSGEVHKDQKIHKTKKKGTHWRNGGTPEILPPSHVKLHQLFLEERVENGVSEPSRLVKLKRRPNKFPFGSKSGISYMEKLLETPLEDKVVHEIPLASSPLILPTDISNVSGVEALELSTVGSGLHSMQQNSSPCASPGLEQNGCGQPMDDFSEDFPEGETSDSFEAGNIRHELIDAKDIAVDDDIRSDGSRNGYRSDDIVSETDNFVDALATMESETETETESRVKTAPDQLNADKQQTFSEANGEQVRSQFSDSQSIGNSTASADGNSSIRKDIASCSYSDTGSGSADNMLLDSGDSPQVIPSGGGHGTEIAWRSSDQVAVTEKVPVICRPELEVPSDSSIDVSKITTDNSGIGEVSSSSCPTDSALPVGQGAILTEATAAESDLGEMSSRHREDFSSLIKTEECQINFVNPLPSTCMTLDVPSPENDYNPPSLVYERNSHDKTDSEGPDVSSSSAIHFSKIVEAIAENEDAENSFGNVITKEHVEDGFKRDLVDSQLSSPHSIVSHAEDQLLVPSLPESNICIPDIKPDGFVSPNDTTYPTVEMIVNSSLVADNPDTNSTEEQLAEIGDGVLAQSSDAEDIGVSCSTEKDLDGTFDGEDGVKLSGESTPLVDLVASDLPLEISKSPHPDQKSKLDERETETVQTQAKVMLAAASAPIDGDGDCKIDGNRDEGQYSIEGPGRSGLVISKSYVVKNDFEYGTKKEQDQEAVTSLDLNSVPFTAASYYSSNIELLSTAPGSSLASEDGNDNECEVTSANNSNLQDQALSDLEEADQNGEIIGDQALSDFEEADQIGEIIGEVHVVSDHKASGIEEEIDEQVLPSPNLDSIPCTAVSSNHSNAELLGSYPNSPLSTESKTILHLGVAVMVSSSSNCPEQDKEQSPLDQVNHIEEPEDISSSSSHFFPDLRTSLVETAEPQTNQLDEQLLHAPRASKFEPFDSLNHMGPIQHSEHVNEPRDGKIDVESNNVIGSISECSQSQETQSSHLDHERESHDNASEFCSATTSAQTSLLEPPQSSINKHTLSDHAKYPSTSVFSGFSLLPELPHLDLQEMPPLPPLPPMQWRMGKLQHSSQTSGFPPIFPPLVDQKSQMGHSAMVGGNMQPASLFLASSCIIDNNSSVREGLTDDVMPSSPSLLQLPTHDTNQDVGPAEEGKLQPSANPLSPTSNMAATVCTHSSETPHQKVLLPPDELSTGASLGTQEQNHHPSTISQEKVVKYVEEVMPQLTNKNEQSQPSSGGEIFWSTSASSIPSIDDIRPTEIRPPKLLRPRSPLIDAVAAHDKSKLKKVAERVRPQPQKVEERDSLLEQIRAKSFNLKPAVPVRPSIQGPKTNLKVAAILEKANAIRQAFAGSDEDDDSDSWSDS